MDICSSPGRHYAEGYQHPAKARAALVRGSSCVSLVLTKKRDPPRPSPRKASASKPGLSDGNGEVREEYNAAYGRGDDEVRTKVPKWRETTTNAARVKNDPPWYGVAR